MAHTLTHLAYHLVFSTKDRIASIDEELKQRLHPYIGGILREIKAGAITIGGTSDHVHILVTLPPTSCVSDVMRTVKTNSSRWVHSEIKKPAFAWQVGYAAFTVNRSSSAGVARYITDQEEHHRKRSFRDELIVLLKKHGVDYDARYIWE